MYLKGIYDASNVPGFALGSTMMGFSIIAKEAGFNFWFSSIGIGSEFTAISEFDTDLCFGFANFGHLSADLYSFKKNEPN